MNETRDRRTQFFLVIIIVVPTYCVLLSPDSTDVPLFRHLLNNRLYHTFIVEYYVPDRLIMNQ